MINKLIILFEVIILLYFSSIIYKDWNGTANVKDLFSLMIIGEIGIELYLRVKTKTK